VTIGAVAALLLAVGNLVVFLAGVEVAGSRPTPVYFALYEIVMLVMVYGLWRARYWAVLGLQALLGLTILIAAVSAMFAADVVTILVILAIILPSGALFYFLVKALARIQMPERP
jgi:hypothetical protein